MSRVPTAGAAEPAGERTSGLGSYLIAVGTIQLHRHDGREVLRQQQRCECMSRQHLYQQPVVLSRQRPRWRRVKL